MEKTHSPGEAMPFNQVVHEEVHGRSDFQFPQLEMARPDLAGLPAIELGPGYTLRHYREGDAEVWGRIMSEAFTPYWNTDRFQRSFLPHFGFKPERVIFVCHEGRPVGSASAFQWPGIPRDRGYIHMVGVLREHCGRGLGYWLTLACLNRLREEGFTSAMLQTEDYRIPAIKHYLRLGFTPVLVQQEQREKWERLLERMGGRELAQRLGIAGLPVMGRFAFWWRTTMVVNYMSWLNLKSEVMRTGG
ncbi:MAG TPA: GNAT family N-acetyltransferase [bacterium]|nr:GNAT family N-acetyltransferase [bacterium]